MRAGELVLSSFVSRIFKFLFPCLRVSVFVIFRRSAFSIIVLWSPSKDLYYLVLWPFYCWFDDDQFKSHDSMIVIPCRLPSWTEARSEYAAARLLAGVMLDNCWGDECVQRCVFNETTDWMLVCVWGVSSNTESSSFVLLSLRHKIRARLDSEVGPDYLKKA